MPRVVRLAVGALVAATIATGASAQPTASSTLEKQADQIFSAFTRDTPGCAVGVYQNGKTILAKGYGSANLEYGVPIAPTTPFIVGSVSKQFTAAAIALLVEEKRIALSDDVRKYVPELRDYGSPITIDHLVHHTSGLRDWWELVGLAGMRFDDTYAVQDVLDMTARQHGLNFTPGDRYVYSNTGYIVLGLVVQRVTGKTLREFAAERIFDPLKMTDSHYQDDHTKPVRGRAYAYSPAAGGYTINVWNNDLVGQGGVMTTVLDLAKWDANFDTGAIGGPGFLRRQLERGRLNAGTELDYAFGIQISSYRGLDLIEHSGSTGGYRAVLTRFPKQRTSIAVLCNVSNAAAVTLAHRVADYLLRDSFTAPAASGTNGAAAGGNEARPESPAPAVQLSASALGPLAGSYFSDELGALYEITVSGSALMVKRPRGKPESAAARDAVTFVAPSIGRLRFTSGPDGRAERFVLDAGRVQNITFVRR